MIQIDRTNFSRSTSDSKKRRKLLLETGKLADCTIRVSEEQPSGFSSAVEESEASSSVEENEASSVEESEASSSVDESEASSSAGDESADNISHDDVSDTIFSCHKMVLATASEVFERMFFGDFKGDIRITDIDPEVFYTFLKYIYIYELDPKFVTASNFKELMYVADKYMVDDFSSACIEILKNKSWDLADIFPIFEVACFYENMSLLSLSYEKICTHAAALLIHWTFYELDVNYIKRLMILLTQYDELDSITLLNALERYGKKNRRSFRSHPHRLKMLVDAACNLNFSDTSAEEYASGPGRSYLFEESQSDSDSD